MSNNTITILTCWYGDYPWYFPYFVKSCRYNPTVDFVIITDNLNAIIDKPDNIKVLFMTLQQFKINAFEKLGFEIVVNHPYKLCDFKPAYGFLFPEVIKDYTFWGYGDLDMVYGNIRGFMTENVLKNYDILTCRSDITMGTFCLYRNVNKMNNLFMMSRDYKYVFMNEKHFCFDECNFLFKELERGHSILDYPENIQSMTYLAVKGNRNGDFRAFFDHLVIQGMSNKIRWDKGLIIYNNQFECMFYDMIQYKVQCENKLAIYPIPDIFYFNKKGINKNSFLKLLCLRILKKIF